MKSLGLASDLLAMSGESVIERHPDRVVQRTPGEPDYWFGNRVLFRAAPSSAAAAISRFRADFPQAAHVCLGWDVPGLPIDEVELLFAASGLIVEQEDVLTLTRPLQRAAPPKGIALRPFAPEDWGQSEEIALDESPEHISRGDYRAHLARRSATRRAQIARGLGQWFGAFDGDRLAGDMGVFHDQRVIRYQAVQTRKEYRRRGICSALLCHALDWARSRAPLATPVIVAEADSDAGRLYRRAGFAQSEALVSVFRPPE